MFDCWEKLVYLLVLLVREFGVFHCWENLVYLPV